MDELARDVERGRAHAEERRWRDATAVAPTGAGLELQRIESIWSGDGPREALAPSDPPAADRVALRREAARLFVLAHAAAPLAAHEALKSRRISGPGGAAALVRVSSTLAAEPRAAARTAWQHTLDKAHFEARGTLTGRGAAVADAWASLRGGDGEGTACAAIGWDAAALRGRLEAVLHASDDAWRDLGGWILDRRLGVRWDNATEADVRSLLSGPGLAIAFPGGGARLAAVATGETCGLWPAAVKEDTTDPDRGPAAAMMACVRAPNDVRLAFAGASPDGPGAWASSLRALGQAATAAAVHPDVAPATRLALATDEARAVGAILATLALEPTWWRRHAAVSVDRDMARQVALCRVGEVRLLAARGLATLAVLRDGPTAEAREVAGAIWRRALGVEPGPWCWLWELDPLLDGVEQLEADDRAVERADAMIELHDEQWFRVEGAGDDLLTAPRRGDATPPGDSPSIRTLRRALQRLE